MTRGHDIRSTAIRAYASMLDGEVGPFADLLADDVRWLEPGTAPIRGRESVLQRLTSRLRSAGRPAIRGVEAYPSAVRFRLDEPWWEGSRRFQTLVWGALALDATHTLILDEKITELAGRLDVVAAGEHLRERLG